MDILNVKVNQGLILDFFHLQDTDEGQLEDIFIPNYKPAKRMSSIAIVTFESDQGGNKLIGVSERALGFTYTIYRERNDDGKLELVAKIAEREFGFL